jgi:hypothetical protein
MVSDVAAVAFLVSVCRSVALIFFSFLCFRCEHFAWISEFGGRRALGQLRLPQRNERALADARPT